MSDVFTVSEKFVKDRDGSAYNLGLYKEGQDYVRRRNRFGFRVIFRKGFLDEKADVVDPSLVEHKQHVEQAEELPGSEPVRVVVPEHSGHPVVAKITKTYPNPRFVETDVCGRVFCGEKGRSLKAGRVILVADGRLVLGKAGVPAALAT